LQREKYSSNKKLEKKEEHVVLVITYYFPPSGGAGVQRWLKFCKYLPAVGVQPIVLTVDERYASYPLTDRTLCQEISPDLMVVRTKTREILHFYRHLTPSGELPHTGFGNEQRPTLLKKIFRFIRGNFFLPDPRRGWNRYAYQAACDLIEQHHISTIVTSSTPHSTHLVGWRLKRRYPHIKWVADFRDSWTDMFYNRDLYQSAWAKWYNAHWERKVLEQADEVVTVSNGCKQNLQSKTQKTIPIHVIPNGYDETDFMPLNHHQQTDKFLLSYVGSISSLYETATFLTALSLLPTTTRQSIRLRFVGDSCPDMARQLEQLGIEAEWLGYTNHRNSVAYMQAADMLLLLLPNQPEGKSILTGKLFEYMASGKPVLMIGHADGDAANVLRQYEDDGIFSFGQTQQIAQFITRSLTTTPVVHPQTAEQYSRRNLTQQIAQIL